MPVELKSILLGLTLPLGAFALKSGAGHYFWLSQPLSRWRRVAIILTALFTYFLVFSGSWYLLTCVDLFSEPGQLQNLFATGVYLHLLLAIALFASGLRMLANPREKNDKHAHGWQQWLAVHLPGLLLTIPCPVCSAAIFLTCAFLHFLFPTYTWLLFPASFAYFVLLTLAAIAILALSRKWLRTEAETLLGRLLIFLSLYFSLTLFVVPQFKGVELVYKMAVRQASIDPTWLKFMLVVLPLVGIGFFCRYYQIQRSKTCNPSP